MSSTFQCFYRRINKAIKIQKDLVTIYLHFQIDWHSWAIKKELVEIPFC